MDSTAITFCMDNKLPDRRVRRAAGGQRAVRPRGSARRYAGRVTEETLLEAIEKMEKAVEHTQSQFATVRTGRATPAIVEKLIVDYYGADVPLQQLAGFSVPEARMLVVKPHDRNSMAAIEKAIRDSDLGVEPNNDGVVIRLNFPPLTEERRRELREGGQAHGRGRPGGGAQPAPGRPQAARSSRAAPARSPPTSSSGPRRSSRRSPTSTSRRSTRRSPAKSTSCSRCSRSPARRVGTDGRTAEVRRTCGRRTKGVTDE